jgi:hypothetical protein
LSPGTLARRSAPVQSNLDLAFIQFGPITAGRAQSFFDFYANDYNFASIRTSDTRLNLLAYTATFGSGFSATVSLEDRVEREVTARGNFTAGGQQYPDLVGTLNITQGWGAAQLSGAIFERKYAGLAVRRWRRRFQQDWLRPSGWREDQPADARRWRRTLAAGCLR